MTNIDENDEEKNVRVKLLDVDQVLACLGYDIGGCVEICLTRWQVRKLKNREMWFEEVTAPVAGQEQDGAVVGELSLRSLR